MISAATTIANVKARMPANIENQFSDADFVDAYNDALDEVSDATEVYELNVTITARKWATYHDLRGMLPTSALRITAVFNVSNGKWLDPTTTRELDDTLGRRWERNVDYPRWWFMRGLFHLGIHPTVGVDDWKLRVYFSAMLPHVELNGGLSTGLTSSPNLPDDFDDAIERYMLSSLFSDFREGGKAVFHWQEYQQEETGLKDHSEKRMSRERTYRIGARRGGNTATRRV